jgi:hypothetical protein
VTYGAIRILVAEFGFVGRSVSNGIQLVLMVVMSKMIGGSTVFMLAQAADGRPGNLPGQQNQQQDGQQLFHARILPVRICCVEDQGCPVVVFYFQTADVQVRFDEDFVF